MNPLLLSRYTVTSCIGRGVDQTLDALRQQRDGLKPCAFDTVDLPTCIGELAYRRREKRTLVLDYLDNLRMAVDIEPC